MKRLFSANLLIIIAVVLAIHIVVLSLGDTENAAAQTYTVNDQPISLSVKPYPGWEIIKGNSSGNIFIFRPLMTNWTGVGVYAIELPYSNVTLNEFSTIQIKSLDQSYKLLEHNMTSLSNLPAYQAIYIDSKKGTTSLEIWTMIEDIVIKIIYIARSNQFLDYLEPVKSIIKSIQFS
jgi:hypothetical protein